MSRTAPQRSPRANAQTCSSTSRTSSTATTSPATTRASAAPSRSRSWATAPRRQARPRRRCPGLWPCRTPSTGPCGSRPCSSVTAPPRSQSAASYAGSSTTSTSSRRSPTRTPSPAPASTQATPSCCSRTHRTTPPTASTSPAPGTPTDGAHRHPNHPARGRRQPAYRAAPEHALADRRRRRAVRRRRLRLRRMTWPPPNPPRGHPMEPGQYPGPLYPPGAPPRYTPSAKPPFAKAVKRAMAHLGAWPWDPPSWDEAWSNAAAYGTEDPDKAGMKACQAWAGTIDPTGNVGTRTFDWLRSVLIPQGRTHAGEPAWDSVCVQLTQQAYDAAYPPEPQTTIREKALELAVADIGLTESPAGSNMQKFGEQYGENGVAWCAIAATCWYLNAGHPPGLSFQTVKQAGQNDRHDFVPYVVSDARNGRYGFSVTGSPTPGDITAYNWGGSSAASEWEFDHVGLFEAWTGAHTFTAVEGNTSVDNNSNGGAVMRRSRDVNGQGTVFIRVAEPA